MTAWIDGWFGALGPGTRSVLTVSWQASVLVLIVLSAHTAFGRWLSPRWRYALWSVVVLRLMLPVTPGSVVSVFNLFRGNPGAVVVMDFPVAPPAAPADMDALDLSGWEPVAYAAGVKAHEPVSPWSMADVLFMLWLIGVALVLGVLLLINLSLALRLRRRPAINDPGLIELINICKREMGVKRAVTLVTFAGVKSPALTGYFRPKLLVPPGLLDDLPREELRFILLHELAHVKKHDIAVNWLLIALSAAHWFNPLVWFAFSRLRADRELARDAMVLRAAGADASQAYGQTIIRILERLTHPRLSNPALAGIGDGMGQLKRRLRMIALSPKRRPMLTVVGAVLLAMLAAIGLTDAAERGAETEQLNPQPIVQSTDEVSGPAIGNHKSISFSFDEITLEQAFDEIKAKIEAPLVVNWDVLRLTGIDRSEKIHIGIGAESAEQALLILLKSASDGKGLDAPEIERVDGVVTVSTRRDLRVPSDAREYDIRNLLENLGVSSVPTFGKIDGDTLADAKRFDDPMRAVTVGRLMDLIRGSVGHFDDWEANGGDYASVRELNGNLVIKTSPNGHRKVVERLAGLQKGVVYHISFEGRILAAPERFCEELGLGLGAVHVGDDARVSFLDDLEVERIISAARRDPAVLTLAVPRILLAHGQDASVTIERQTGYTSDYKRVEQADEAAYEPVVQVVAEGVVLKTEGKVSEDRRNVIATLEPVLTNIVYPIEKVLWPDSPEGQDLFIDKPTVTQARSKVAVTVPDRGTVLIDVGAVSGPMGKGVIGKEDPVEEGVARRVFVLVKPTVILDVARARGGAGESAAGGGGVGEVRVSRSPELERGAGSKAGGPTESVQATTTKEAVESAEVVAEQPIPTEPIYDTRVYDIRDLLVLEPHPENDVLSEDEDRPHRDERLAQLINAIAETVGHFAEWSINGGDKSSISGFGDKLVIRTSTANHGQIEALLTKLRAGEPGRAGDDWRARFDAVYRLDEGEVVKRIAPPFIPERMDYYRAADRHQAEAIPRGPDVMHFKWNNGLEQRGSIFGADMTIERLLNHVLDLYTYEYVGDRALLNGEIPGDWVYDFDAEDGAKREALVREIEEATGRRLRIESKPMERDVIVAEGNWRFKPLDTAAGDRLLHVYAGDRFDPSDRRWTIHGDLDEFFRRTGWELGVRIEDRVTDRPEGWVLQWWWYPSSRLHDQDMSEEERSAALRSLLDNLAAQTGLTFTVEKRGEDGWVIGE